MAKLVDLVKLRRGRKMLETALRNNPDVLNRLTQEDICMAYESRESKTVTVRFPLEVLEALDAHTRERAYRTETHLTRNAVIVEAVRDALKASQQGKGKAE